jgi:Ca2+-binding EF-hand superfamily protein
MDQRNRFFQASGGDGELDHTEFAANQSLDAGRGGQDAPFVRKFDRWAMMVAFDRNRDRKIDWFEADAYRKALRQRVLAAFDTNEDGQLGDTERDAANRALAAGQTTPLPPPPAEAGPEPDAHRADSPQATSAPSHPEEDQRRFVAKYDGDHDGKVDDKEREAARRHLRARMAQTRKRLSVWRHDADGNGQLSPDEKKAIAASQAEHRERVARQRKEWLRKYDADGDGKVSAEERRKIDLAEHDANHDGRLDDKERKALRDALWKRAEQRRRDQDLAQFDRNGDGRLDRSERAILAGYRQEAEEARREWLASYDVDGDGKLSDAERKAMQPGASSRTGASPGGTDDGIGPEAKDVFGDTREMDFGDDDPNASYRERLLKQYDADGDGHLNTEERARMWRDLYRRGLGAAADGSRK